MMAGRKFCSGVSWGIFISDNGKAIEISKLGVTIFGGLSFI
jgi:hypothetical protein